MNREKFEMMAEKYNLDLNKNEFNYLNFQTQMAWEFFTANQAELLQIAHVVANAACFMDDIKLVLVHSQPTMEMRISIIDYVEKLHDIAEILAGGQVGEIYKSDDI
jgi:hypothetical protein